MQDVARDALVRHLGDLPVGHRLPPIKNLARQLGLGQSNLHEAMRALAREGVLYSRPKVGTFVAQRMAAQPGMPAAPRTSPSVAGRSVQVIGAVQSDPAIWAVSQAAHAALAERGVNVVASLTHAMLQDTVLDDRGCEVSIVINPSIRMGPAQLPRGHAVIVSTSWHARTLAGLPCDLVGVDQYSGAMLAGKALARTGCDEICYLGRGAMDRPGYDAISQLRLEGLEAGFGRAVPDRHRLDTEGYSMRGGARGFNRWYSLSPRPRGVFAVSDDVAMGFYAAAVGQGLQPLRDFHLVGFDGLAMGQNQPEPLTTVELPFADMGRAAVELVVNRLLQPDRPIQVTYLGCRLVEGRTCGAQADRPGVHT